ncbi:MAG: rod shape-determining protein MreD [Rikenellaceae bacterium]
MYKFLPYMTLFVVTSLLQVLFFNNLSVSVSFSPLVYVVFILLLPLQIPHFGLLMAGLGMGVVMDWSMGASGVNTIATLFIAFCRPYLLNIVVKKEVLAGSGVPSDLRLGEGAYSRYLILLVLLHHAVFFALESLSLENWALYALRFVVSSVASTLFVWLIARVFVSLVLKKYK